MIKNEKYDLIVNAAMELLAEEGFHGAPMALIAEKAGVGAGTIYRYFENRDLMICKIYNLISDELTEFIKEDYPSDNSVRECFFYIGKQLIKYHLRFPVKFSYSVQFHHSPYGLEMRRSKLFDDTEEFDFCRVLFEKGQQQQVIKDIPLAVFFILGFAPMFWAVRDHYTGFIDLDDKLAETIVSSCWESVRM